MAEGTLSLSEKDKQYQLKMDLMRKDLANMANAIETRIDSKLTTFENGQQIIRSTIETQIDQALKRYSDQIGMLEKKILGQLDDRVLDTKKASQESLGKSLEQAKFDYESLINRLGTQIQDVIARLKQDQQMALVNSKREFEDKIWTFKNEMDDLQKVGKLQGQEDVMKFKEEIRGRLDESELRTHKQFSKLLDETTQAIEDSINTNLIG